MDLTESSVILNSIKKQFLCTVPLNNFNWHNTLERMSLKNQEELLISTINCSVVKKYPIQTSYQRTFVKFILNTLEKQETEITDSLYDAYGRLVALPVENYYFKHYLNNDGKLITLKENVNLISNGTTGLRTWQAALALAEFSLNQPDYFHNQNILELGSGIGLTGLVIASNCSPKKFYFTDCHSSVLQTLCENVLLNLNHQPDFEKCDNPTTDCLMVKTVSNSKVLVYNLAWENINLQIGNQLGTIDKIIAADIIYDSDLFNSLINAMENLVTYCKVQEFLFACTKRNQDTLDLFLNKIKLKSFKIQIVEVPMQNNFIWSNETPINMYSFTK